MTQLLFIRKALAVWCAALVFFLELTASFLPLCWKRGSHSIAANWPSDPGLNYWWVDSWLSVWMRVDVSACQHCTVVRAWLGPPWQFARGWWVGSGLLEVKPPGYVHCGLKAWIWVNFYSSLTHCTLIPLLVLPIYAMETLQSKVEWLASFLVPFVE